MEKEPIKKLSIKKTLTVAGLAMIIGASSIGFAKADSKSGDNSPGTRWNQQLNQREQFNQRHEQTLRNWQENRDCSRDDRNSHKEDERCDRDKRDNEDRYKQKRRITLTGKVESLKSDELKIKIGKKTYKIDIDDARIIDRKGKKIDDNKLKKGKRVIIWGIKDDGKIEAKVVKCLNC